MSKYKNEVEFCKSEDFKRGEYLYMFMMDVDNTPRCFGVGYTIQYTYKKGIENIVSLFPFNKQIVSRPRINKVKVGEIEKCDTFELYEYFQIERGSVNIKNIS